VYITYHSEAWILASFPHGEANARVVFLTETLGLLSARATSVREERSTMRYALQPFTFAHISVVRGRDTWRVIGAEARENLYVSLALERKKLVAAARMSELILRVMPQEELYAHMYQSVSEVFRFLKHEKFPGEYAEALYQIGAIRLLDTLGYVRQDGVKDTYTAPDVISKEMIVGAVRDYGVLSRLSNEALTSSHL